ncbi:MAG: pseudouridine synthase, partial [Halanaerobiales bacterium]
MERLQKVMAHAGIASRRKSEEFIRHGEVKVNGKLITEPGYKVDPEQDKILVRGEDISLETKVYILLNKPAGYISTVDDPQNRKTVLDIIPNISQRIYPVGRLDRDSRGLLLLTNDGDLTYKLTHPSHEIQKTYLVEIKDRIKQNKINKLEQGIELEDGLTSPAKAKILKSGDNNSIFTLTIS